MLKRDAGGGDPSGRKRKRSRWGDAEVDKAFIPGMPTVLPGNMSKDQEELYLLQLQIEEISRRLRSGDLGIPANPEDRSPSPEPIYNNEGKRLNTREYRVRKKLEEDRHELVTKVTSKNPDYKPPADYKPPVIRVSDKVMIPQEEHPDINFVGLLIGPRGNTLKNLEKDTGAKIIIRGKGSVKEGKIGRKDGQPLPGEDEPLHAYITANNPENVKMAAEKIKEIIRQGIEVPEGQNDLRRQQLRELALLNGTLRENDGLAKLKQLQQATTIITNTIVCTVCGGTGHIAQDCKAKRPGDSLRTLQNQNPLDKAKMDSEYSALMAELGQGPPPSQQAPQQQPPPRPFRPTGPSPSHFNGPPPALLPPPVVSSVPPPSFNIGTSLQSKPPSLLNIATQPPTSAPMLGGANTSAPQPLTSSLPPWQNTQQPPPLVSQPPPAVSSPMGVLSAPPPPPPPGVTSGGNVPWQQQPTPITQQAPQQPPPATYGMPPPPPGGAPPPWQTAPPPNVAPVPPPPPMATSMPPPAAPWQTQQQPQQAQQRGFNPVAPPPPPPSAGVPGAIPLGVPPPPPPN